MFKLVVLSALLAAIAAAPAPKPGFLHAPLVVPAAVSHSSRIDFHSQPIVTAYAAPALVAAPLVAHHAVVAAPIVKDYGLVGDYGFGYGYGHGLHGFHGGLHGW